MYRDLSDVPHCQSIQPGEMPTAEQLAADPAMGEVWLFAELRATYGHAATVRLWRNAASIYRLHYAPALIRDDLNKRRLAGAA